MPSPPEGLTHQEAEDTSDPMGGIWDEWEDSVE